MGKFDGMDPKLVRDLLAEVKHAVTQMRSVEGRVGQVMSGAGLATQTTHRPVQVADAAEVMVRDVTARLGLLEKKADPPRVGDQSRDAAPTVGGDAKDYDDPKEDRGDERSKYQNPRADDGTPSDDSKPHAKTGEDKPDAKTGEDKPDAKTDDKPDAKTGDDKPDAKTCDDDKPDAKTGEDKPDAKTGDDKPDVENITPDTDTDTDTGTGDGPKDDDIASRRDRGSDSDGGIIDTPAKDHPDDSDPHKPQVVVVDGVKVLQVPIDPPTAEALRDLLDNLDKVQPADMPSPTDAASPNGADAAPTNGGDVNAWANDGSDVVSVDANGDCQATDTGTRSTGDATVVPPSDPPGQQVPDNGTGHVTPTDPPGQQVPDNGTGHVTPSDPPGQQVPDNGTGHVTPSDPPVQQVPDNGTGHATPTDPSGQRATDASTPTVGEPVVVGPTEPSAEQGGSTATDAATPPGADTSTRPTPATTVYAAAGDGAGTWAGDGSDVVSVDARPMDPDALRTLVGQHRDVQSLDMPSVEVPPGEYGKGEWALRDIQPDGSPGTIEPGNRERSA